MNCFTEKMETERKITKIYLLPNALNVLVALIYTFLIINSKIEVSYLTIFSEAPKHANPSEALLNPNPYLNAIIFVALLFLGLLLNYFLIKRNLKKILKILSLTSFCMLIFLLTYFYLYVIGRIINLTTSLFISYFLLFSISILIIKMFYSKNDLIRLLAGISVGSGIGSAIGFFIPYWTSILILIFVSIYDIIMVFRGPLKKIFEKDIDLTILRFALIDFKGLIIGLGDIVFYSLLISYSFINFGLISVIAASIGILIGSKINLSFLKKDKPIPGLPAPISIGLMLAILFSSFQ